jgi:hypothetical protein
MAIRIRLLTCVCAFVTIAAPSALAKPPVRNRHAFSEAMNKVQQGMSQAEVIALVGKPDDVSTQKDWDFSPADVREIWRYGAAGHMKVATLGQIDIDHAGRVAEVFGQGSPPPDGLFTEAELSRLCEVIYDLRELKESYNPRWVIRAVNALQPLGKEKALAAVSEFMRVSSEMTDTDSWEYLILVLRSLFEVPDIPTAFYDDETPKLPGVMLPDTTNWIGLDDPRLLPRFPITIEGDIPFLLSTGPRFSTGPGPEPLLHVAYFRKYGTLRAKPLAPTNKPFAAIARLIDSPRWRPKTKGPGSLDSPVWSGRGMRNQALRLLDTVHALEPDDDTDYLLFCCCATAQERKKEEAENKRIVDEVSKLTIRWDPERSLYTRLDGTYRPPFDRTLHPSLTWRPGTPQLKIEILLKRLNRWYVELWNLSDEESSATTRVFDVKIKNRPLAEIEGALSSSRIRADEGREVQLELTVGKQTFRSPIFKP